MYGRSYGYGYGDVGSDALRQTPPESRCQARGVQAAAVRRENLLQGGPTWPGKREAVCMLKKQFLQSFIC